MATPYGHDRHDIGILRQDGSTKVGLMCVQKNGAPVYGEFDDEYIADQQTQTPGYDSLPVEKELAIIGDDWRSGFGLDTFDSADPKRYNSAYNADLRFRGMAFLSNKATAATLPTLYTITDGAMEVWSDVNTLTNWTKSGTGTLTREATTIHGGTYSAKLYANAGAEETITQDCANWSNNFQGKLVSASVWVNLAATTGYCRIAINDGVGTTYSSNATEDGTYNKLTVSRTLDASATRIRIQVVATGGGAESITAYVDDLSVNTYGAHFSSYAEFNDDLYFASNDILVKVDDSTGTISYVGGFPAAITCLTAYSDNNLYIALGTSNAYWYMSTAEAVTESTAVVNTFNYFCFVHTTADTMYGSDSVNTIRSTTNPANGGVAWSAQTTVDTSANSITGLLSFDNALYIFKEDRPFYLDSTGAVQTLTNITTSIKSSTGGKNSMEWMKKVFMPWGTGALLEFDSGASTLTWLNPSHFCSNLGDFDGQVFALAADEEYLYAAVDNATKIEILAGRYETIDNSTSWVWHTLNEITLTGVNTMSVSSVYSKRLWIGSTSSSDSLYYIPLPTGYGNITADANRDFQSTGYFITPWMHANFKGDSKAWIKMTLTMANTTANIYWTASYQKKGDSSWTSIGDFTTSPTTTKYIPVDASSNNPVSKMMRFKFVGTTNSVTTTPILYNYDIRAILYPTKRSLIMCQIRAADEVYDKTGQRIDAQAAMVKTVLDEAMAATWPVTLYDIEGTTKYVKFLPMPKSTPRREIVKDEKGRVKEWRWNVLLQEVTLST